MASTERFFGSRGWFRQFTTLFLMWFCLGFMLFFRITPNILPNIPGFLNPLIAPILSFLGRILFGFSHFSTELWSDSKAVYVLLAFLTSISVVVSFLLSFKNQTEGLVTIRHWFITILRYYLAYQLLYYGFNKVFKWQFFLPEPNTVYTPLGQITPDLLYWSAVGSSYSYTVLAGVLEVLTAVLLLFRSTYRIGALLAIIVMANVVAINFGFNISVKVFSLFLFLISWIVLGSDVLKILDVLRGKLRIYAPSWTPSFKERRLLYTSTKIIVVLLLVMDALFPYIDTKNFNDDMAKRPKFHGAYAITSANPMDWEQVFFHRRGYFIVKDSEQNFTDYNLTFDTTAHQIRLDKDSSSTYFSYETLPNKGILLEDLNHKRRIELKRLPYRDLPIFKRNFNWWID